MLVLRRKKGEKIVIDKNIEIIFDTIDSNSIKVLIKAPKEVKVLRGELLEKDKNLKTSVI